MQILYLHGLESKLSEEKRQILEKYGNVFAPEIDYSQEHILPHSIFRKLPKTEINVIIGSSMGALNGYIISNLIGRPALLFNPPLSRHPEKIEPVQLKFPKINSYKQILLGAKDEIVDPRETLVFLSHHFQENEIEIKIDPFLGHRIPKELFEEQVAQFFSKFCY